MSRIRILNRLLDIVFFNRTSYKKISNKVLHKHKKYYIYLNTPIHHLLFVFHSFIASASVILPHNKRVTMRKRKKKRPKIFKAKRTQQPINHFVKIHKRIYSEEKLPKKGKNEKHYHH